MQIQQKQFFKFISLAFILVFFGCQSALPSHAGKCDDRKWLWIFPDPTCRENPPAPFASEPEPEKQANNYPGNASGAQPNFKSAEDYARDAVANRTGSAPERIRPSSTSNPVLMNAINNAGLTGAQTALNTYNERTNSNSAQRIDNARTRTERAMEIAKDYATCMKHGGGRVTFSNGRNGCSGRVGAPTNQNNSVVTVAANKRRLDEAKAAERKRQNELPKGVIKDAYGFFQACGQPLAVFSIKEDAAEYAKKNCPNYVAKKKDRICECTYGGLPPEPCQCEDEVVNSDTKTKPVTPTTPATSPTQTPTKPVVPTTPTTTQAQTKTKPAATPTPLTGKTGNSGVSESVKKHIKNIKKIDSKGKYTVPN